MRTWRASLRLPASSRSFIFTNCGYCPALEDEAIALRHQTLEAARCERCPLPSKGFETPIPQRPRHRWLATESRHTNCVLTM